MSQLYSGQVKVEVSREGFSLSILSFIDSLNLSVVGVRVVIGEAKYQMAVLKFGQDVEALKASLAAVNVNHHLLTVFGQRPAENEQHFSNAPFREVTLEQLIGSGLLVPVK